MAWCNIEFVQSYNGSSYYLASNPLLYAHNLYLNDVLVTDLVIPDTVKTIKGYAFYGATCLTSITIGNNVTLIGYQAFYNCSSLTSLTIPDSITSIESYAFSGCSELEKIYITDISAWCNIKFSFNPLQYAHNLYLNNKLVTEMVIPDTVENINSAAFSGATCLKTVTIPDSVTSIGSSAFAGCSSLTSITIPDSVTSIGFSTFTGCDNLIYNEYYNVYYLGNDNNPYVLLMKVKDTAISCLTINDKTKFIFDNAFSGCESLADVIIPDSVVSIGTDAFSGCSSLISITISDSVTSIGSDAFSGCPIEEATIPALACDCIANDNLKTVVITSGDSIGSYAFSRCSNLTNITIPDSVISIGDSAFYYCSSLTSIIIPDSVTSICSRAFRGCSSLEEITIPFVGTEAGKTTNDTYQNPFGSIFGSDRYDGGVETNQKYYGQTTSAAFGVKFYIPRSLRKVTVTGGNILFGAFYNCCYLTSIILPDEITSIGPSAFYNCNGLTSITIPDSVTSIGSSAFDWCSNLSSVYITDIMAWCNIVFGNEDSNPLSEAHNLYLNNELVTEVVIPDAMTSIHSYVFCSAKCLQSVTIGNNVTVIGWYTFAYCDNLTRIDFEGTKEEWQSIRKGSYWKEGNTGSFTVYCTDGVISKSEA